MDAHDDKITPAEQNTTILMFVFKLDFINGYVNQLE